MEWKYDRWGRLETPDLTLCYPGCAREQVELGLAEPEWMLTNQVGVCFDAEAVELVANRGEPMELNFRLNRVPHPNPPRDEYEIYNGVVNRMLIFMDGVGFFQIVQVTESLEDGARFKDVRAMSIEVELRGHGVPYIPAGTYPFVTDAAAPEKTGVMEQLLANFPGWTMGTVQDVIAHKSRTFEDVVDVTSNCYDFLMNTVQDLYECELRFDILERKIHAGARGSHVPRGIADAVITQNFMRSMTVTEEQDGFYTALQVLGGEEVTISLINPLGTNVIYNFDYYLRGGGAAMFPAELAAKVTAWQEAVAAKEEECAQTAAEYYRASAKALSARQEIERWGILAGMYIDLYGNIANAADEQEARDFVDRANGDIEKNGGTKVDLTGDIEELKSKIQALWKECFTEQDMAAQEETEANGEAKTARESLDAIHSGVAMDKYFTAQEYALLAPFIIQGSYNDENVVITDIMTTDDRVAQMKLLYSRGKAVLEQVEMPRYSYEIEVDGFVFREEFSHWLRALTLDNNLRVERFDGAIVTLYLNGFTLSFDDKTVDIQTSTHSEGVGRASLFHDVFGDVTPSANSFNYAASAETEGGTV